MIRGKDDCQLEGELKQTRPFESTVQIAVVGLLRTSDLVRRRLGAVVLPSGITLQQYNVLRILRGAGDEGLPTLEIAARMIEETPGVTRLLDRLESKKLVRRQRCARDRRQHLCWLTDAGAALLRSVDPVLDREGEKLLSGLRPAEQSTLVRLLDSVRRPFL